MAYLQDVTNFRQALQSRENGCVECMCVMTLIQEHVSCRHTDHRLMPDIFFELTEWQQAGYKQKLKWTLECDRCEFKTTSKGKMFEHVASHQIYEETQNFIPNDDPPSPAVPTKRPRHSLGSRPFARPHTNQPRPQSQNTPPHYLQKPASQSIYQAGSHHPPPLRAHPTPAPRANYRPLASAPQSSRPPASSTVSVPATVTPGSPHREAEGVTVRPQIDSRLGIDMSFDVEQPERHPPEMLSNQSTSQPLTQSTKRLLNPAASKTSTSQQSRNRESLSFDRDRDRGPMDADEDNDSVEIIIKGEMDDEDDLGDPTRVMTNVEDTDMTGAHTSAESQRVIESSGIHERGRVDSNMTEKDNYETQVSNMIERICTLPPEVVVNFVKLSVNREYLYVRAKVAAAHDIFLPAVLKNTTCKFGDPPKQTWVASFEVTNKNANRVSAFLWSHQSRRGEHEVERITE